MTSIRKRPVAVAVLAVSGLALTVLGGAPATADHCGTVTLSPHKPNHPYPLPDGRPGQNYTTTIIASGGSGNYFWQLGSGGFPPGLSYGPLGVGGNTFAVSGTRPRSDVTGSTSTSRTLQAASTAATALATGGSYYITIPYANLVVTQSAAPNPAVSGQDLTFTVDVINYGEYEAKNAVLTDTLPEGVEFASATWTPFGGGPVPCTGGSGTVTCQLGTLSTGSDNNRGTATIVVKPQVTDTLTNVAEVSSDTYDEETTRTNNSSLDVEIAKPKADLEVGTTADNRSLHSSDLVTYTVGLYNRGPDRATGVTLEVTLDRKVYVEEYTTDRGSCKDVNSRAETWTLESLAKDHSWNISFDVDPLVAGKLEVLASASSDALDPPPTRAPAPTSTS